MRNGDNSSKPLIQVPVKKRKYIRKKTGRTGANTIYKTAGGHPLTAMEAKFIDLYIETGNQRQSVIDAGYKTKAPGQYAQILLKKIYIASEIAYRLKLLEDQKTASAKEILEYFTAVMRGEEKDQFGLDAPLSERTKAAQELAKRMIDIPNRLNGKQDATVTINLTWDTEESEKPIDDIEAEMPENIDTMKVMKALWNMADKFNPDEVQENA